MGPRVIASGATLRKLGNRISPGLLIKCYFLLVSFALLLLVLPAAILLISAFGLALAAFRRVKRLERRLEGTLPPGALFR